MRKEVHIAIETHSWIKIIQLMPVRQISQGIDAAFEVKEDFFFMKQKADVRDHEDIKKITIENIGDTENLIAIHKTSGEIKVMSKRIEMLIDEQLRYAKLGVESDEKSTLNLPLLPGTCSNDSSGGSMELITNKLKYHRTNPRKTSHRKNKRQLMKAIRPQQQ